MKYSSVIPLLSFLVIQTTVIADLPESPRAWIKTSERCDYLFKMVPGKWRLEGGKSISERAPFGVAYKINEDGDLIDIWHAEGWYAYGGHLSANGRFFVGYGPWGTDQEKHTDTAISFYDQGKLLKEYQVRELIKKPEFIENSVSHYMWTPATQTEPNGFQDTSFHLVMIDKTIYTFDVATGNIIATGIDAGALSRTEVRQREDSEAEKRGQLLFERSNFKEHFERYFIFSSIEHGAGKTYTVYFDEPEWGARMKPVRKHAYSCEVEAVFPVKANAEIIVSVDPKEIDEAFTMALSHPFVSPRFVEGGATGIRLRITGDRLHWNTPELQQILTKLSGVKPNEENLRHWAYFIIDAKNPRYTSIYFNTETKHLIFEDESKWPRVPTLLDADGIPHANAAIPTESGR